MAKLIDGKIISQKISHEVRDELKEIRIKNPSFMPKLAIVQVFFKRFFFKKHFF